MKQCPHCKAEISRENHYRLMYYDVISCHSCGSQLTTGNSVSLYVFVGALLGVLLNIFFPFMSMVALMTATLVLTFLIFSAVNVLKTLKSC